MESKHFFEGYSRSKDVLDTLGNVFAEATLTNPWMIKSQGRIPDDTNRSDLSNRKYVCLKKTLKTGDIINVLFYDEYNTSEGSDTYGLLRYRIFWDDGFDVVNKKINHENRDNGFYGDLQYHSSAYSDSEVLPNFAWYWIRIDEDDFTISVFGNVGATGTAPAVNNCSFFGQVLPNRDSFEETYAMFNTRYNDGIIFNSTIYDYFYPSKAPHNWATRSLLSSMMHFNQHNDVLANPNSDDKFLAHRLEIYQRSKDTTYGPEYIPTHHTNSILFCHPGIGDLSKNLVRGDIVSIDTLRCDYIFQSIGSGRESSDQPYFHILIKRMESVFDLRYLNLVEGVELEWKNPDKCYGVKILRKENSEPSNHNDGVVVFDITIETGLNLGSTNGFLDVEVEEGKTYFYKAFSYSSNEIYSVPVASAKANLTR